MKVSRLAVILVASWLNLCATTTTLGRGISIQSCDKKTETCAEIENKASISKHYLENSGERASSFWEAKVSDVALAVFTLFLVIVGFRQEKITKVLVDVLREAKAFNEKNANDLQEREFREDRAYVFPQTLSVRHKDDGSICKISADVILHNYGKTPALISRMHIFWSDLVESAPLPKSDPDSERFSGNMSMLGANESVPPTQVKKTLSQSAFSSLRNTGPQSVASSAFSRKKDEIKMRLLHRNSDQRDVRSSLYLIIWVEYEDIFHRAHITGITKRYDPDYDLLLQVPGVPYDVRT